MQLPASASIFVHPGTSRSLGLWSRATQSTLELPWEQYSLLSSLRQRVLQAPLLIMMAPCQF